MINYGLRQALTHLKIDDQFQKSTKIYLNHSQMDDLHFEHLSQKYTKYAMSYLLYNNLTSLSIVMMKNSKWNSLVSLDLSGNYISDIGCYYLAGIKLWSIQQLGLTCNMISSIGVGHLSKAQWKYLQILELAKNYILLDGIKLISKSSWSRSITCIIIYGNQLDKIQLQKLFMFQTPHLKKMVSLSPFEWLGLNPVQQFYKQQMRKFALKKFHSAKVLSL